MKIIDKLVGSFLLIRSEFLFLDLAFIPLAFLLTNSNNLTHFFILLAAVLAMSSGTHTTGEFCDAKSDIFRQRSPINRGLVTKNWAFSQAVFLKLFSLYLLLSFFDILISLLGMFCILISIAYSASPFRYKRTPFVGTSLLTLFYLIEFLIVYLAAGGILNNIFYIWTSIIFINYFITLLGKDYKDYDVDKKHGIITPVVFFGPDRFSKILSILTLIPLILLPVFIAINSIGLTSIVIFLILPLKVYEIKLIYGDYSRLGLRIHNAFLSDAILLTVLAIIYLLII